MKIQNIFPARKHTSLFLAFFVCSMTIHEQTPTPDADAIRVSTDLIQTNITVVDKNKRFVDGLKAGQLSAARDG